MPERLGRLSAGAAMGLLIAFALSGPLARADTGPDPAVAAAASGDYATAAQLWMQRAQQGDAAAEYNLGVLYRSGHGVPQDMAKASQWFRKAARQGLVDAYNTLAPPGDKRPISADKSARAVLDPKLWIVQQNPSYYTLQLASSKNRALIEKYITENDLQGHAGYYESIRNGQAWYALVYGTYPNKGAAQAAVDSLPQALRKWKPWVRQYADIQRIMKR